MQTLVFIVGLLGAAAVSYGASLMYLPAGFVVGGLLALIWSFMAARALAFNAIKPPSKK